MKRKYSGSYGSRKRVNYYKPTWKTMASVGTGLLGAYGKRLYSGLYKTKTQTDGVGTTTQYDKTLVYRKKSMPRRKKRAYRKGFRKWQSYQLKQLGSKTLILNDQLSSGSTNSDLQGALSFCLYGMNGDADTTFDCGWRDLRVIMDNDGDFPISGGVNRGKALFGSGILDITMRNSGASVELDLYEVVFTKQTMYTGNLKQMLIDAFSQTPQVGVATTLNLNVRGVTPFEAPLAIKRQGIKILKKEKYFLGDGAVATYQFRDAKNRRFNAENVTNIGSCARYQTRGFIAIFKRTPGQTVAYNVSIGVTRKYLYKILNTNNDVEGEL